jgi:TPR repeat protein
MNDTNEGKLEDSWFLSKDPDAELLQGLGELVGANVYKTRWTSALTVLARAMQNGKATKSLRVEMEFFLNSVLENGVMGKLSPAAVTLLQDQFWSSLRDDYYDECDEYSPALSAYRLFKELNKDPASYSIGIRLNLLRFAADQGIGVAAYALGQEYLRGDCLKEDLVQAEHYAHIAIHAGCVPGFIPLGIVEFRKGETEKAEETLLEGTKYNVSGCYLTLAELYQGLNDEDGSYSDRIMDCYQKAAELNDPTGLYLYATVNMGEDPDGKNSAKWMKMLERAAKLGSPEACGELGDNAQYLPPMTPEKNEEALRWYTRGMGLGSGKCACQVYILKSSPESGITPDYPFAYQGLEKLYQAKIPDAYFHYYLLLKEGLGTKADPKKAEKVLEEGASLHNGHCLLCLAMKHENGEGRKKDSHKAYEYGVKAGEVGFREGFDLALRMAKLPTASEEEKKSIQDLEDARDSIIPWGGETK